MQVLYSKFTRARRSDYQIETSIIEERENRYVIKKALNESSKAHLRNIGNNYEILSKMYGSDHVARIEEITNDRIRFSFIHGISLENKLLGLLAAKDMKIFYIELSKYMKFVRNNDKDEVFEYNKDVFCRRNIVTCTRNIDLTFDNLIISNESNKMIIIDYEWMFEKIPCDFIIFRAICSFYGRHQAALNNIVSLKDLLAEAGIENKDIDLYYNMEKDFQAQVSNDLKENYVKEKLNMKNHRILRAINCLFKLKNTINWFRTR